MTDRAGPTTTWQVELTIADTGDGRSALILHGGGGPATVAPIVDRLSNDMRVITPTHPGWDGTARPDWFTGIDDIALTYLYLLQEARLNNVLVVGSSIGGWIASEMAVRDTDSGRISGLVLIDSVGVKIPGEPIREFFALDAYEVAEYSFHDSHRFYVDPSTLTPERSEAQRANMATMRTYAGDPYMHDPKLLRRLSLVTLPVLAIWGDSDQIVTPAYGQATTNAFGNGEFALVPNAGHLPQIEQPDQTFALIEAFLDT